MEAKEAFILLSYCFFVFKLNFCKAFLDLEDIVEYVDVFLATCDFILQDEHEKVEDDEGVVACVEGIGQRDGPKVEDRIKHQVICDCRGFLIFAEIGLLFAWGRHS